MRRSDSSLETRELIAETLGADVPPVVIAALDAAARDGLHETEALRWALVYTAKDLVKTRRMLVESTMKQSSVSIVVSRDEFEELRSNVEKARNQ